MLLESIVAVRLARPGHGDVLFKALLRARGRAKLEEPLKQGSYSCLKAAWTWTRRCCDENKDTTIIETDGACTVTEVRAYPLQRAVLRKALSISCPHTHCTHVSLQGGVVCVQLDTTCPTKEAGVCAWQAGPDACKDFDATIYPPRASFRCLYDVRKKSLPDSAARAALSQLHEERQVAAAAAAAAGGADPQPAPAPGGEGEGEGEGEGAGAGAGEGEGDPFAALPDEEEVDATYSPVEGELDHLNPACTEPESELQEELDGLEQQLNDEYNRLEDDWDDDDDGMETDSDL
jgi:hypothetical protein